MLGTAHCQAFSGCLVPDNLEPRQYTVHSIYSTDAQSLNAGKSTRTQRSGVLFGLARRHFYLAGPYEAPHILCRYHHVDIVYCESNEDGCYVITRWLPGMHRDHRESPDTRARWLSRMWDRRRQHVRHRHQTRAPQSSAMPAKASYREK